MKLKDKIKELEKEQRALKPTRKTGSNPIPSECGRSNRVAEEILINKARITATLNLYHELRGSDYRHNIKDHWTYENEYNKFLKELKKKIAHTKS